MKPLLKTDLVKIPLKLDRLLVDRIDVWAGRLSQSRAGMTRLMIRLSGPIIEKMVECIPLELRRACQSIEDQTLFFHNSPPVGFPVAVVTLLHGRRTKSSPDPASGTNGNSEKPGRGQKSSGQTGPQAQTATAGTQTRRRGHRSQGAGNSRQRT